MKIKKLDINQYRHLENLTFDFTYKTGEKKGQPLDKICLIGQSATGKTSILEFIKELKGNYFFRDNKYNAIQYEDDFEVDDNFMTDKIELIYLTSEILSSENYNNFHKEINPEGPFGITTNPKLKQNKSKQKFENIIVFSESTVYNIWVEILSFIYSYRINLLNKINEAFAKSSIDNEMFSVWKKENPNPLTEIANNCLNPILKRLNLEVDLIDTSVPIPLKPINKDKPIPITGLSTGTKQLLLSALPLFKLDTENSIILIDEPERSLYPDMQMELISYYQNLAPNAQFIVATHSPFIAASFEPEERFILYFDENGKVQVKNGVSPIGDDPNDMLTNDFMVNYLNHFGEEAYKKYVNLKQQIVEEKNPDKKKELLIEAVKLGDKYKF